MGSVGLGAMAGAGDGYYMNHGGPIPLVLSLATVETKHAGTNLTYIPKLKEVSPTFGMQFKFHF